MELEEIRKRLKHRRMGKVCLHTGLHPNTVRSFINAARPDYSHDTVTRLIQYLEQCP